MRNLNRRPVDFDAIRLLVTDLDGVWTDGSIYVDDSGAEALRFSAHDGLAVKLAHDGGLRIAILSARNCPAVYFRMTRLGVDEIRQGSRDKAADFDSLCRTLGLEPGQAVYMGDDLTDLAPGGQAAVAVTVPQAPAEVRLAADFMTEAPGGAGAVRETVEWLLRGAGRWDETVRAYQPRDRE